MRTVCFIAVAIVLLCSLPLFGQQQDFLIMGTEVFLPPDSADGDVGVTRTDIDLQYPAICSGTVSSAIVYWSTAAMPGCTISFKVKFFRRVGDRLTLTAERGPFTPNANRYTATLTPPVAVQQGDLIGVTRLTNCGNPMASTSPAAEGYLQYARDVSGTVEMSAADAQRSGVLAAGALGGCTERLTQVIPVVGSTPGGFGSYFRTELQMFMPDLYSGTGEQRIKLVFRRAGVAGSSADTMREVNLRPGEVFSAADIVAEMGESGVGSLDITFPAHSHIVNILARVYNDAGSAGTAGLSEEALWAVFEAASWPLPTLLERGTVGYLVTPRNPLRTRFNVGVRTLFSGATIQATLRDAHGVVIRRKTHTYTATWFVQMRAEDFVGGSINGDESIRVDVLKGSAFIYGSTTDNVTNDPTIQVVRSVGAFP